MKNYTWFKHQYIDILKKYQYNKLHPIIMIQSKNGIGTSKFILKISQWLLCFKKKNKNSCNTCMSCNLILQKKHPDFYTNYLQNLKKKILGIDYIRNIIEKIYNTSQQGGLKIVWFKNVHYISQEANNALLKTLEEPPKNTIFFLCTNDITKIKKTLKSRSTIYYINTPKITNSIQWLKKNNKDVKNSKIFTALRINNLSLIKTNNFLKNFKIYQREKLINTLKTYILTHQYTNLILLLSSKNTLCMIVWICYFIIDAIKYQLCKKEDIFFNIDNINLIKKISKKNDLYILNKILLSWIKCHFILKNIPYIDKKLILTEQVLFWTKFLKKNK